MFFYYFLVHGWAKLNLMVKLGLTEQSRQTIHNFGTLSGPIFKTLV